MASNTSATLDGTATLEEIRALNPAYIMDRQGKDFVMYAGLLDYAHRNGLARIATTLLQAPDKLNEYTCIMHAHVEFADGRAFDGVGDANPGNVSRGIAPHLIRMAETRAKARALRDGVNVGGACFEELGPRDPQSDDDERVEQHVPRQIAQTATSTRPDVGHAPVNPQEHYRAQPSTPVVVQANDDVARLKSALKALDYPIDDDAIARMSVTQLRVQRAALVNKWYELHPEKDTRAKPADEAPVVATPQQARAIRSADARVAAVQSAYSKPVDGYREEDIPF